MEKCKVCYWIGTLEENCCLQYPFNLSISGGKCMDSLIISGSGYSDGSGDG